MSIDVHEAMLVLMLLLFFSELSPHSKAIRDMLPIIDPEEDYLTIVAAEERIASAEDKRKKELEEAHANLRCKMRPRRLGTAETNIASNHSTIEGLGGRACLVNATSLSPVSRWTREYTERARYQ